MNEKDERFTYEWLWACIVTSFATCDWVVGNVNVVRIIDVRAYMNLCVRVLVTRGRRHSSSAAQLRLVGLNVDAQSTE